MEQKEADIYFMELALQEAKKGRGYVAPNPPVGAVVVKDGVILSTGYHKKYGDFHAERNALLQCKEDPAGATLYVTLEPCCHYGKTPPCTEFILEKKIRRVVVGCLDVNPLVAGKGIRILQEAGVEVEVGICEEACQDLIRVFSTYMQRKTPFVCMKYAMTLDGKISTRTGASKWITGEKAREHVHKLRHELTGILVGVNTILTDDPQLTCRTLGGVSPHRFVADTALRTPLDAYVVRTAKEVPTTILTAEENREKWKPYEAQHCQVLLCKRKGYHLDLQDVMGKLGNQGIDSILLEGGATLSASALQEGIVDEVCSYISPKLFGGGGKTPLEGAGVALPADAYGLKVRSMKMLGEDLLIRSEVQETCLRD